MEVDSFNSLLGRLGFLAGYETLNSNIYAKVSWQKEFDGKLTVKANRTAQINENLGDNWWVFGLGATHLLNSMNALYLNVERSAGGDLEQTWKVNGGWRVMF